MKLLMVIDHLGLGGAQRQLVELACGLRERGHHVEFFVYFPQYDFFRERLAEQQIVVHACSKAAGISLGVLRSLLAVVRGGDFDLMVSFLNNPNAYAELASLLTRSGPVLVVSERCSYHDDHSVSFVAARRLLHARADSVVTNSQTHARWLERKWWLRTKVSCIYNGVDLDVAHAPRAIPGTARELRLLAVGRVCPQKNLLNLVKALELFRHRHGYVPQLSWAGKRDTDEAGRRYAQQVDSLLAGFPEVHRNWHWLGQQGDMPRLLREHHALVHPSFYEGLPNAVCEALAAGMPALVSNVCDHAVLVADGERGFLFDPHDPASIVEALAKLAACDAARWSAFAANARSYAERDLSMEGMVAAYERLFLELDAHDRVSG